MYLDSLTLRNLRVFDETKLTLQYPGKPLSKGERELLYPNVNLILGNNGAGKSSLLKAIALAALGPLGQKFPPYKLVRDVPRKAPEPRPRRRKGATAADVERASIEALFQRTWQDLGQRKPSSVLKPLQAKVEIHRHGDEEFVILPSIAHPPTADSEWNGIADNKSPAFLTVGYGATRRVDTDPNAITPQQQQRTMPLRQMRVQSLFSEGHTLVPLTHWLPSLKVTNKGRFTQVCNRLNDVLPEGYAFTGDTNSAGDYLFRQRRSLVPFPALSDGARAFVGWVADLLYHINTGCPSGVKLTANCGTVLVDEIDLHLHPEWQRVVIPRLAAAFPNLQFIFTSHSPIVVGSLQRENLWVCEPNPRTGASEAEQKDTGVHGLNADQILLTEYFGLKSSRAKEKEKELDEIAAAAERGVPKKAHDFLRALVTTFDERPTAAKR